MCLLKKYFFISFIAYLISGGLVSAKVSENLPPVGKETQVYMGDRMVEQRSGAFIECLIPNFNVEQKAEYAGNIYIIKKDVPMCEEEPNSKIYMPPYVNALKGSSWLGELTYEVKIKREDNNTKMCFIAPFKDAYCKENLTSNDYTFSKNLLSTKDSFQRVIEYAGKKGSVVKFIYSEFKDDMLRGAFTREYEVDLSDGKTVAYKGCIFEVIKVDNATIKYKVIRHFKK